MNFSFFKYIKSLFKHLLLFILFHNKNLYPKIESTNYGGHKIGEDFSQASKNPIHLILLNIFFPGRIYQRIRYGWFPILLDSKSKKSTNLILFPESNEKEESLIKRTADTIKVHGAAVVDGYFSNQKIDEIKSQYRECMPSDNTKNMDGIATGKILPLDISNFWLDEFILNVTCNYMGRFPYASTYPFIASYKPTKHKKTKKFADFWHMDLGCYFTATIFLDDILQNGSRMEIVS